MNPTKEEAAQALFKLATGTSSPDIEIQRVLVYFGLTDGTTAIPWQFRDAVRSVVRGLREATLFALLKEQKEIR